MTKRALLIRSGYREREPDCGHNSIAFMRALLGHHGFVEIAVCEGDDATRDGIVEHFEHMIAATANAAEIARDPAVVVYYTGHCDVIRNSQFTPNGALPRVIQHLCPTDFAASDATRFLGITSLELSHLLARLSSHTRNVTAIWDTCFSAQLGGGDVYRRRDVMRSVHPKLGYDTFAAHFAMVHAKYPSAGAASATINPDLVRIAASDRYHGSWGMPLPEPEVLTELGITGVDLRRQVGGLTRALAEILVPLRDRRVSWNQLVPALRACVYSQRPEIEGPTARVPFSIEVVEGVGVPISVTGDRATLDAGRVLGVAVGDVYVVVTRLDDRDVLARITVDTVSAHDSEGRIAWRTAARSVPAGCVAIAIERAQTRYAVRVVAPPALRPVVAAEIAASPRLRVADDDEPDTVAELRVDHRALVLGDDTGPLFPPAPYPSALASARRDLENFAAERRLHTLVGDLDLAGLAIELGSVDPRGFTAAADHGAAFSVHDRVAIRIENRNPGLRYVHGFNIGLRRQIRLVHAETSGIALAPGASTLLGETLDSGALVGFPLSWPVGLPRDRPRAEAFMIVVTNYPVDLRALETTEHLPDAIARGGGITRSGTHPDARPDPIRFPPSQFAIVWRTFSVVPID
jgi:hypothetical protein